MRILTLILKKLLIIAITENKIAGYNRNIFAPANFVENAFQQDESDVFVVNITPFQTFCFYYE